RQLFGVCREPQAGSLAGVIATDSPQPQALVWFGLLKTNVADSLSTLKSISVPSRKSTAFGSTSTFTPLSSTISSLFLMSSAYSTVYDIPAQPPFFTPTRSPAIGLSERSVSSRILVAAASVRRITCGFGRKVAILVVLNRVQGPAKMKLG